MTRQIRNSPEREITEVLETQQTCREGQVRLPLPPSAGVLVSTDADTPAQHQPVEDSSARKAPDTTSQGLVRNNVIQCTEGKGTTAVLE